MSVISGFSKFSLSQRLDYIVNHSDLNDSDALKFKEYNAPDENQQRLYTEMIENYIGNFPIPIGIVTNMVINNESYIVPFVTEESSVVAAASKAAKFWARHGGFHAEIISTLKKGQVHFTWNGDPDYLNQIFPRIKIKLLEGTAELTDKMRNRGGGIIDLSIINKTSEIPQYYQLDASFETGNAMGANFINTCLEKFAYLLKSFDELNNADMQVEVIMSILSNYTPDCRVKCWVECPVEKLNEWNKDLTNNSLSYKIKVAVDIANLDVSRAVTHNKGICNGVDAVLLAAGNDFRATEACVHAYASRDGKYRGLTNVTITDDTFRYELDLPLAIGTVGGITGLHPLVKNALAVMNYPDSQKLMMIAAASGLANNFAAIASLVSTGIQSGHMKMHLSNILNLLHTDTNERNLANEYFNGKTVSHSAVNDFIESVRRKI